MRNRPENYKEEQRLYMVRWRKEHLEEARAQYKKRAPKNKERRRIIKQEVLTHYGGDRCACIVCGESRLACLSIDHINGGGAMERGKYGHIRRGDGFYRWLRRNSYPLGYQTLCMNCQWIKRYMNNEAMGGLSETK